MKMKKPQKKITKAVVTKLSDRKVKISHFQSIRPSHDYSSTEAHWGMELEADVDDNIEVLALQVERWVDGKLKQTFRQHRKILVGLSRQRQG